MVQIKYLQTFRILNIGTKALDNYNYLSVHMWFDVKFVLGSNSLLFEGDYMTGSSYEVYCCGLVNIGTVSKVFFIEHINNPEVDDSDVGNSYIHGFTNEKI